jgi:hypothetical protein
MKKESIIKLAKAINEIKPIVKDSLNPHFKNKYFDINGMLDVVKPILSKNKLMLLQPIISNNVCSQIFDVETGELIAESTLEMNPNLNAQQKGSEITYFRRYTLQSLLGLEAEDDDANQASVKSEKPKQNNDLPWLNLFDKQNNPTEQFKALEAFFKDGKKTTIASLRKKYKVAAATEKQLKVIKKEPKCRR